MREEKKHTHTSQHKRYTIKQSTCFFVFVACFFFVSSSTPTINIIPRVRMAVFFPAIATLSTLSHVDVVDVPPNRYTNTKCVNVAFCTTIFFCYTYAKQWASDDIGSLAAWKLSRSYHTFDFCLLLLWLTLEWMRCFLFLAHDDYISGLGWLDIDSIDNTGLVAALIVYITSHKYICSIFLSLSLTLFIGFFIVFSIDISLVYSVKWTWRVGCVLLFIWTCDIFIFRMQSIAILKSFLCYISPNVNINYKHQSVDSTMKSNLFLFVSNKSTSLLSHFRQWCGKWLLFQCPCSVYSWFMVSMHTVRLIKYAIKIKCHRKWNFQHYLRPNVNIKFNAQTRSFAHRETKSTSGQTIVIFVFIFHSVWLITELVFLSLMPVSVCLMNLQKVVHSMSGQPITTHSLENIRYVHKKYSLSISKFYVLENVQRENNLLWFFQEELENFKWPIFRNAQMSLFVFKRRCNGAKFTIHNVQKL